MFLFAWIIMITPCFNWTCAHGLSWSISCLLHVHVFFFINKVAMLDVMWLQNQHHNVMFYITSFPLSLRISLYLVASYLVVCHWSRAHMEMLSNHVLQCLTCTLMTCFCLPRSCSISSLFHASNMWTCYFCSHVCPIFHQVIICVIKLLFALIILV